MKTRKNNTKIVKKNKSKKRKVYNSKDFKSGDGMLTTVWGPGMWHYLHTMSFNYPNMPTFHEKKSYRNFILSLRHVLPCKYCRINFKHNLKRLPLTIQCMKNRHTFSMYVYRLHELINKMLNKKSNLTYEEVRNRYEHFRARCADPKKNKIFPFRKTQKKEKGCTESLYGKKSKCVLKIVPQEEKCKTFQMDKQCEKKRVYYK